jgi:hypothetical protein
MDDNPPDLAEKSHESEVFDRDVRPLQSPLPAQSRLAETTP